MTSAALADCPTYLGIADVTTPTPAAFKNPLRVVNFSIAFPFVPVLLTLLTVMESDISKYGKLHYPYSILRTITAKLFVFPRRQRRSSIP